MQDRCMSHGRIAAEGEHLVGQERGHLSGALAAVSGGPAAAADADASPHLRNMRGFTSGGTPRSGGPRYRVILLW